MRSLLRMFLVSCFLLSLIIGLPCVSGPSEGSAGTYRIEADGSGDVATIEEALRLAIDGTRIELGEGAFVLGSPQTVSCAIQLSGKGADRTLVICEKTSGVLVLAGDDISIEGIGFDLRGSEAGDVVLVAAGSASLRDCSFRGTPSQVEGFASSGVWIKGEAQAEIRDCFITGTDYGIAATDSAVFLISGTECTGCLVMGIAVHGNTSGTISGCSLRENLGCGLCVSSRGTVEARENTCVGNVFDGIFVVGEARPTLVENTCSENERVGISFWDQASGTATANRCSQNLIGVYMGEQAQPTLSSNICEANGDSGIAYVDTATGTAETNTCSGNTHGIYVSGQARPTLVGNTCSANSAQGILYKGSAGGKAQGNRCTANSVGIGIFDQASPTLTENTCDENSIAGILYSDAANGTADNNQCMENDYGISVQDTAQPTLVGNECGDNTVSGIAVSGSAAPEVRENVCFDNATCGIVFRGSAGGMALRNECYGNRDGIDVQGDAHPTLVDNDCHDNTYEGILLARVYTDKDYYMIGEEVSIVLYAFPVATPLELKALASDDTEPFFGSYQPNSDYAVIEELAMPAPASPGVVRLALSGQSRDGRNVFAETAFDVVQHSSECAIRTEVGESLEIDIFRAAGESLICLSPGTHPFASRSAERSISIRGEGSTPGDVRISGKASLVAGYAVLHVGRAQDDPDGPSSPVVRIENVTFEDVVIHVHDSSRLILKNVEMRGGPLAGIWLYESGAITLEECTIDASIRMRDILVDLGVSSGSESSGSITAVRCQFSEWMCADGSDVIDMRDCAFHWTEASPPGVDLLGDGEMYATGCVLPCVDARENVLVRITGSSVADLDADGRARVELSSCTVAATGVLYGDVRTTNEAYLFAEDSSFQSVYTEGGSSVELRACSLGGGPLDGFFSDEHSTGLVTNCTVSGETWIRGESSVQLTSCTLDDVTAWESGEFVLTACRMDELQVRDESRGALVDCVVESAGGLWAVDLRGSSVVSLEGTVVRGGDRGAIVIDSATLIMRQCEITRNEQVGIRGGDHATLELDGCTISDNGAEDAGFGVYVTESTVLSMTDCTVTGNYVGIYVDDHVRLSVEQCSVKQNETFQLFCFVEGLCQAEGGAVFSGTVLGVANSVYGDTCPDRTNRFWPSGFFASP